MGKQAIGGGFSGPGGMKLPFPKAVRAGDFVFVSGQMATGADIRRGPPSPSSFGLAWF
jgi:enamine deaminase RidA (YjgF/YER057c/UK114 family)